MLFLPVGGFQSLKPGTRKTIRRTSSVLPAVQISVNMQQLMRFIRQRLLKIRSVQTDNLRILMRISDLAVLIKLPKHGSSVSCKLPCLMYRLTAAACTASRTGHNLYKIIVRAAVIHSLHQPACICESAHRSNLHSAGSRNLEYSLLPRFVSSYL